MVTKEKDFKLVLGNTLTFSFQLVGLEDEVDNAVLSCKTSYDDDEYAFQVQLDSGISEDDGIYTVRIAPEDTEDLEIRQYVYDLKITTTSEDAYTLMRGALTLLPEVTGEVL